MPIEGLNPYYDYGRRVHYNKLGITSQEWLTLAEADFVESRLTELQESPASGAFDFQHLKDIHRQLFQDVYEWAGQQRQNLDAGKQEYVGGPVNTFAPSASIDAEATKIFGHLALHDNLRDLPLSEFVQKAAVLHNEINLLHTFPEGNGRTQREFLRQLSVEAGHPIDFRVTTEERIIAVSIAGQRGDHAPMERLLTEATDPEHARSLRLAVDHLEKHLGVEKVSTLYIATTTPGQEYAGTLVDRAGKDFMFQQPNHHILIGRSADIREVAKSRDPIRFVATDGKGSQLQHQPVVDKLLEPFQNLTRTENKVSASPKGQPQTMD